MNGPRTGRLSRRRTSLNAVAPVPNRKGLWLVGTGRYRVEAAQKRHPGLALQYLFVEDDEPNAVLIAMAETPQAQTGVR